MQNSANNKSPISLISVLLSTLSGAFGVQSDKNRKRDFAHKSMTPFIFMGIGFTIFFVLFLTSIAKLILYTA